MIKSQNAKSVTQNAGKIRRYTLHAIRYTPRGFTLVEVLVTLSIFSVITGVIFANYRNFSGGIVLSNLAYEIAITIRQAQVYGVAVKNVSGFNYPYGTHFSSSMGNSFVLFADVNRNGGYDLTETVVETLTTTQGNTIYDLCATPSFPSDASPDCSITSLDITFIRPEPDAKFKTNLGTSYKEAIIIVKSPRTGNTKTINVKLTGQISVE